MKFDRTGQKAQRLMARAAESNYNARLRQVSKQIDAIVKGLAPDGIVRDTAVVRALRGYADLIRPWARSVAASMLADVGRRNVNAWKALSTDMSKALKAELMTAPTGSIYAQMMEEQVGLITSLPLESATRVQELTTRAMVSGQRSDVIAKEILRTGEVSAARARTIARTEVSRSASLLTQARSTYAGSEGYIWRTSGDGDVRDTHKALNGKFIRWDDPPKTDAGLAPYHAGQGPNCRCFAEPVLPDL